MLGAVDSSQRLESRSSIKIIAICSRVSCEDWEAAVFGKLKASSTDSTEITNSAGKTRFAFQRLVVLKDPLTIVSTSCTESRFRHNIAHSSGSTTVSSVLLTVFVVMVAVGMAASMTLRDGLASEAEVLCVQRLNA